MPRWWDKNFTLMVGRLGTAGVNFEHAPYDGATVVRMVDDAWHEACALPLPSGRPSVRSAIAALDEVPAPTRRLFDLSDRTKRAVVHAHAKNDAFCSITKVVGIEWTRFGKAAMKGWRMSPDGCIQMAYQLAYYRLHGPAPVSVYESASTKKFLRGRTEAIRPVTAESKAFVDGFDQLRGQGKDGVAGARALLDAACARHRTVAGDAAAGLGVDRHLFSLASLQTQLGEESSDIFTDEMWTKFNTSVLSTSNVNGASIKVLGFGAVCPQGYGLGYTVEDDSVSMSVSNYTGDPDTGGSGFGGVSLKPIAADAVVTNAPRMAAAIQQALLDIEAVASSQLPSKL